MVVSRMIRWRTIGILCCLFGFGLATPLPQEAKPAEGETPKPPEGGETAKPAEGETPKPPEGGETIPAASEKPPEGGETTPAASDKPTPAASEKPLAGDETPAADGGETTTSKGGHNKLAGDETPAADGAVTTHAARDETNTTASVIMLTFEANATIPANVFTDKYGEPLKISDMKNISLPGGGIMNIMTEQWQTYHTNPPVIPGCQCITRGPLTRFKLIGNLHFPKIKVTPERYVTLPTDPTSTLCPPCVCPTCPTGNDI